MVASQEIPMRTTVSAKLAAQPRGAYRRSACPPGNRLEALAHARAGQWSIRINAQWRVCFRFDNGHVHDVEIIDYY